MKTRIILSLILLVAFSSFAYAQGITNDGATIVIESGTTVTISNGGGYYNLTNGSNHGRIDLDGTIHITGDFENQATDVAENVFINVGTDGTVIFTRNGTQHISNSTTNAFINFENIIISDTSSTFLDDGSAATISGDLTVNNGGIFTLSSPSDGESPSGSLITEGSVSGAGELWVDRHFETQLRYRYVSIPVDNATDDFFDTGVGGAYNPNLYTYNEAYDAGVDPPNTNYSNWTDETYGLYNAWTQIADEMSSVGLSGNGVGYVTYNDLELDISFGGSPSNLNNATSYSPTITYSLNDNTGGAGDYFDGWNIIGNPYPCAVDFTALGLTNVNNCVYFWDGDENGGAGNYKYYNNGGTSYDDGSNVVNGGTQYIPAMQAFSVKTTGSSPSIVIDGSDRVHNDQVMWKAEDEKEYGDIQFIKLKAEANGFSDETVVRFIEEAINDFDSEYDAFKMFPNTEDVPMIYSLATVSVEYPLAINSLPVSDLGTTVPLGFKTGAAGTFTFSVVDYNFDIGTEVKLIDTYDEKEILLDEDSEYTFTFTGDENRERFYLFVAPEGVDIEEPTFDNLETIVNVWSNENNIHISITSYELIDASVEIFDILGKSVIQKRLYGTYNVVNVPGVSGTYFVKLRTKNGRSHLNKVFIQN